MKEIDEKYELLHHLGLFRYLCLIKRLNSTPDLLNKAPFSDLKIKFLVGIS
jgi:hypothetical protein